MTSSKHVVVYPDAATLSTATASRFVVAVGDLQASQETVNVVLTGGTIGIQILKDIANHPAVSSLDWSSINIWWGDERFVPADSQDRNDVQATDALLSKVPVDPQRVFSFPAAASESPSEDEVEAAANEFAQTLVNTSDAEVSQRTGLHIPQFDIVFLGVGPDAHIASLFPGHDQVNEVDKTVVAELDSPKPPPHRLSLTLPVLNSAKEVWLVVSGEGKAEAVRKGFSGTATVDAPVAGIKAPVTRWLVDVPAAAHIPPGTETSASSEDGQGTHTA